MPIQAKVSLIICAIFIISFTFVYLISKVRKLSAEHDLREMISWGRKQSLSHCIYSAQKQLSISDQYSIDADRDGLFVNAILGSYRQYIEQAYFSGELKPIRSPYVISGKDYFMCTLNEYLYQHQCKTEISGHQMHEKTISYQSYGSWGAPLFDATYALSDFGVVFFKLYYISYLHTKGCKAFNPKGNLYGEVNAIEDTINSKQISVSRF